jgi:uncharacterized protein YbdZ (MbtH family)
LKILKPEQDDGSSEILRYFAEETVPYAKQERMAFQTVKTITACLQQPENLKPLQEAVKEPPLIQYFSALTERLRMLVAEGVLNADETYSLAQRLLHTKEKELVRLAILMLSGFDSERTQAQFLVLGRNPQYTLYVLKAAQDFRHFQSFLFQMLQKMDGCAKVAALNLWQPVTEEMQRWALFYGAQNRQMPSTSAAICLDKADMGEYLRQIPLGQPEFSALSILLANAFSSANITEFADSLPILTRYLDAAPSRARELPDLLTVIAIRNQMKGYAVSDTTAQPMPNGWSGLLQQTMRSRCQQIIRQERWTNQIYQELKKPELSSEQITCLLTGTEMEPPFVCFLPLLKKHPCDSAVIHFLVCENPLRYMEDTLHYLKKNLPSIVFSGAEDLAEEDLGSSYDADAALNLLLTAMYYMDIEEENFYLRCLACRLPHCRKNAIRCLRQMRGKWSDAVLPALEAACAAEPNKAVRKTLLRLMGRKDKKPAKEQRYVELADELVWPAPWDKCVLKTWVAGALYRDLLAVDGVLEESDLLYLVREPDNPYDTHAIMVVTDDGYLLGYIPRKENLELAAMMDTGRKFYAFLEHIDTTKSDLSISVYLSEESNHNRFGGPLLRPIK